MFEVEVQGDEIHLDDGETVYALTRLEAVQLRGFLVEAIGKLDTRKKQELFDKNTWERLKTYDRACLTR